MSKHGNSADASGHAEATAERPWHRRSRLYDREADIRALIAEGYSLRQIVRALDLGVSRSALWRFLRRADAAAGAARPAGEPAPAATLAALGTDEAEDAAAEALLASTQFSPPTRKVPR